MTEKLKLMDKVIEARDAAPTAKVLFVEDVKEFIRLCEDNSEEINGQSYRVLREIN